MADPSYMDPTVLLLVLRYLVCGDLGKASLICKRLHFLIFSSTYSSSLWYSSYKYLIMHLDLQEEEFTRKRFVSPALNWLDKSIEISGLIAGNPIKIDVLGLTQDLTCRAGHSATLFDDKYLFLYGGASHFFTYRGSYDLIYVGKNEFSVVSVAEKLRGDQPSSRWLHTTSTIRDARGSMIAILFGGQNEHGCEGDLYSIRLAEQTEKFQLGDHCSGDGNDESGVATGGSDMRMSDSSSRWNSLAAAGKNQSARMSAYSKREQAAGDIPCARAGHSSVVLPCQTKVLVFGGRTAEGVCLNDLYLLDCLSERQTPDPGQINSSSASHLHHEASEGCGFRWTRLEFSGSVPSPRWCHSAVRVGGVMYVFGGWSTSIRNPRNTFHNDLHVLDIATLTWSTVDTIGTLPKPRSQAACMHTFAPPSLPLSSSSESTECYGPIKIPSEAISRADCSPSTPSVEGFHIKAEEGSLQLKTNGIAASQGYLVIYGGACHSVSGNANLAYGNLVVDLDDFQILDLDTMIWLPVAATLPLSRGGVNATVFLPEMGSWILSGGMHSDPGAQIPRFKRDLVSLRPSINAKRITVFFPVESIDEDK